jgi:DNA adenine methylase
MRTNIQPLFKWTGSKQRMLNAYAPHFFPPTQPKRFVDLFTGGLTMTLWMAENYPDCELVINDFNAELMLLYRELAQNTSEVVAWWRLCVEQWLSLSLTDRKTYYCQLRDEYCFTTEMHTPASLSGKLLFMMSVNFNGMWKGYKKYNYRYSTPVGTCTQNERFFDEPRIYAVAEVLRRCEMHTGDFGQVPLRDGDYVYADPPYRDSSVLYQGGFTENDQIRLANYLTAHRGYYAYSNKDIGDGFYTTHFPTSNIIAMPALYTAGAGKSVVNVTEVLITNFSSSEKQDVLF